MSQPNPAPAAGSASPPRKGSPLKALLIIGSIFFVTCIGVCGGLFAWAWVSNPLPSTAQLQALTPIPKTTDDLKQAIPLLQDATYSHVSINNRERHSYGPITIASGNLTVHLDALDGQTRQFVVECTVPPEGDKATTGAARLASLSVIQMLNPTFTGDAVSDFMLFADSADGSRDFGPVHVRALSLVGDHRAVTYEYTIHLAPPGGTPPAKPTGRETFSPQPERHAFKSSVDELEQQIPALKAAGHTTTTDHGLTTSVWKDFDFGGYQHTVTAEGDLKRIEKIVIQTHIARDGEKIDRMAGMLVAMALLGRLDPGLNADQLEGFTKWSWAALGSEDFGAVHVRLQSRGNDDIGQKIEYTFTPNGAAVAAPPVAAPPQPAAATPKRPAGPRQHDFAPWVKSLETSISPLADAPCELTTLDAQPALRWQSVVLGGHTHTVIAVGKQTVQPVRIVVQTHYTRGPKADFTGVSLAWNILRWCDPAVPQDDASTLIHDVAEAFRPNEYSLDYARLTREQYGKIDLRMQYKGEDKNGYQIEFTLTPAP